MHRMVLAGMTTLAMASAGCGDVARTGRAPVQVVIEKLEAANGNKTDKLAMNLQSDVLTLVKKTVNGQETRVPTVFNDVGSVTMSLILKDPGSSGFPASPSALNQVTFTRYRVTYRRTDGRNTPGVDVPYPIDSSATFTVPAEGSVTAGFEIVRHTAKEEAPLQALISSPVIISTNAEVAFYGRDQAGNDVIATGSIGIDFGNFGDPD